MWTIFKLLNLFTILSSAYFWVTANIPILILMLFMDIAMLSCVFMLPIQLKFDGYVGRILLTLGILIIWTIFNESIGMGIGVLFQYIPIFYLIALPREFQSDLLKFVTKWLAILLIPSLCTYWLNLLISLPHISTFVMEGYEPFYNYIFYIEPVSDMGHIISRFNAFFPEPGHLSMVCVFIMMANRFDFKKNPWMKILLLAVGFSFSLAGYVLTFLGFIMLKLNTVPKVLATIVILTVVVVGAKNFAGGENAVNKLIIERLEYDKRKGIKGNNRFFNNTDFEFQKALKSGDYWTGIRDKRNMTLVGGAGFKIYILWHGLIGAVLALAIYFATIPPKPDWHFTLAFLFLIILCFVQNAYPIWYAWIFPYVLGLNINSKSNLSEESYDKELTASSYIS